MYERIYEIIIREFGMNGGRDECFKIEFVEFWLRKKREICIFLFFVCTYAETDEFYILSQPSTKFMSRQTTNNKNQKSNLKKWREKKQVSNLFLFFIIFKIIIFTSNIWI